MFITNTSGSIVFARSMDGATAIRLKPRERKEFGLDIITAVRPNLHASCVIEDERLPYQELISDDVFCNKISRYKLENLSEKIRRTNGERPEISNPIFLVGGGPSLRSFDFSKLQNRTTMCTNQAIFYVPNSTYFVTADSGYIRRELIFKKVFTESKAVKFLIAATMSPPLSVKDGRIYHSKLQQPLPGQEMFDILVNSQTHVGLGSTFSDFRTGFNSGFCAFQLSLLLGYRTIYLLGFDMGMSSGESHFHRHYGKRPTKTYKKTYDKFFDAFLKGLKDAKLTFPTARIFNCSKTSRLYDHLPFRSIDAILSPCDN